MQRPATSVMSGEHRQLSIGLVLIITAVAFEAMAVATVLPLVRDDLGGVALYGWAFSAFMLTNLVGIALAGGESDRRGPARPFAIGLLLFSAGLLAGGLAPSMLVLVAARAVQGLGAGAVSAVVYVAIGRGYEEAARARMLAVLSSAWVIPGLVGPGLSGLVAETLSWRLVFLALLPAPAVAAALALPPLRRLPAAARAHAPARAGGADEPVKAGRSRSVLALQLAAGAGLALGGIGARSVLAAVPLVVAGLVVGVPALRALLPAGTLVARPGLPAAVAMRGLITFAFFGAEPYLVLAVQSVRDERALVAAVVLSAAAVSWTAGSWLQARKNEAWSRRSIGTAGVSFILVGVIGGSLALAPGVPLALAGVAWAAAGFGMGLAYATTTLVTLRQAPVGQEGTASASLQLSDVLGIALGTGLGGAAVAVADRTGVGESTGIAIAFALAATAGLAGLRAARGLPGRAAPAQAATEAFTAPTEVAAATEVAAETPAAAVAAAPTEAAAAAPGQAGAHARAATGDRGAAGDGQAQVDGPIPAVRG